MAPPRKRKALSPAVAALDALSTMVLELEARTGHTLTVDQAVIGEGETFRAWCERLGRGAKGDGSDGLRVDGKPFVLDDRPAMAWIYEQIPSTHDEAYRLILVLMKCAQVGFTIMEMLASIYLGLKFGPATVGMFLPDMNLAGLKSTERFMPIVRSMPDVHKLMTQDAADGSGRKTGEGNVNRRRIAKALFIFSWTSGRATTESVPMDILSFDEVQEMTLEQMEKTVERLSASTVRFTLMGSTANWPDADIHHWYKKGSQHRFRTRCKTCGSEKPLDDYFPECIKWDADRKTHRYVCPEGHWLDDTQHGAWVADNPDADPPIDYSLARRERPMRIRSIHFPQFLSPTIAAGEILDAFRGATDMKNFYNRKLGKPYLDPSQVPVSMEHLRECERLGIAAGLKWLQRASGTFMGIDQMGNFNVVVIKYRLPDGRQAFAHVEEVYSADPFARCDELMVQYGVQCCVVEINPNYNDAKRFAGRHPGKVFICDSFGSVVEGMIQWGDAPSLDVSERRTSEEERDRYTLRMDQYKCMQVSMVRFVKGLCLFPDSQGLVQEVNEKGVRQTVAVLPRAWHHFTKTALVAEKDDETNKFKRVVKKIGIDPHFSYANMLADVAWARAHGTSTFIFPEATAVKEEVKRAEDMNLHGMPTHVIQSMQAPVPGRTCGNCSAYEVREDGRSGWCNQRELIVQQRDPGCPFFDGEE